MNNAAILPYVGMYALQIQNVKRDVVKKANISQLNQEIVQPLDNETNDLHETNNNIPDIVTTIDKLPESNFIENSFGSLIE